MANAKEARCCIRYALLQDHPGLPLLHHSRMYTAQTQTICGYALALFARLTPEAVMNTPTSGVIADRVPAVVTI